MPKKEYYIISTKWTFPDEYCFVFWGPDNCGYTHNVDRAGVYLKDSSEINVEYHLNQGYFYVEKSVIDKMKSKVSGEFDGSIVVNAPYSRRESGINILMLAGGMQKCEACWFRFVSPPEEWEEIPTEKIGKKFDGRFTVGLIDKECKISEPWYYDDIIVAADTHSKAKAKAFKQEAWNWENALEEIAGERWIDNLFFTFVSNVSAKKHYVNVFEGWHGE